MTEQTKAAERTTAERSDTARSAADRRRRAQAIAGAGAGVVVVVALVALLIGMRLAGSDKPATPAAAPAPAASAQPEQQPSAAATAEPSAAPTQAGVQTPAALSKRPEVKGGTGKLSALKVTYLVKGTGSKVHAGQTVTANYVLVNYKTGQVLDSSWDSGQPFSYQAGAGNVIKGFDQGLVGVPVGSRVQLDIPAALAYGAQQGDLRFVVDVLAAS